MFVLTLSIREMTWCPRETGVFSFHGQREWCNWVFLFTLATGKLKAKLVALKVQLNGSLLIHFSVLPVAYNSSCNLEFS